MGNEVIDTSERLIQMPARAKASRMQKEEKVRHSGVCVCVYISLDLHRGRKKMPMKAVKAGCNCRLCFDNNNRETPVALKVPAEAHGQSA